MAKKQFPMVIQVYRVTPPHEDPYFVVADNLETAEVETGAFIAFYKLVEVKRLKRQVWVE